MLWIFYKGGCFWSRDFRRDIVYDIFLGMSVISHDWGMSQNLQKIETKAGASIKVNLKEAN